MYVLYCIIYTGTFGILKKKIAMVAMITTVTLYVKGLLNITESLCCTSANNTTL